MQLRTMFTRLSGFQRVPNILSNSHWICMWKNASQWWQKKGNVRNIEQFQILIRMREEAKKNATCFKVTNLDDANFKICKLLVTCIIDFRKFCISWINHEHGWFLFCNWNYYGRSIPPKQITVGLDLITLTKKLSL